jgi:sugar/nucleoside kinase (ribokinase family)
MWDTANQREAVTGLAEKARVAGARVAFDLADPFAVGRYRDSFLEWIPGRIDVLFGNRQEMTILAGAEANDEDLVKRMGSLAPLAVMKVGPRGCVVNDRGTISTAPARPAPVVDTIGAGDLFAAGFLYGLLLDRPTPACSRIANSLAAAVVGVEGCSLERMDRDWVLAEC